VFLILTYLLINSRHIINCFDYSASACVFECAQARLHRAKRAGVSMEKYKCGKTHENRQNACRRPRAPRSTTGDRDAGLRVFVFCERARARVTGSAVTCSIKFFNETHTARVRHCARRATIANFGGSCG